MTDPEANTTSDATQGRFPVVGIGASAGGLEAICSLLKELEAPQAALLIVSHRAPAPTSQLIDVLVSHTKMPVLEVADGMTLEPQTAYVLPTGKRVSFGANTLRLTDIQDAARFSPIDEMFRALARLGERAVAVVLSGTGHDGSVGVKDVKAAQGIVLVQTPDSARYPGMPTSALASIPVDYCATPEQLGRELVRLLDVAKQAASHEPDREPLDKRFVERVLGALLDVTGHDFTSYKSSTVERRIQRRLQILDLKRPEDYLEVIHRRPAELEMLFSELLIGVTSFFRDPEAFESLKTQFKAYLEAHPNERELRIWVPACSTGEEAYSIAMIARECLDGLRANIIPQIFGTDLDPAAVQVARTGRYPAASASDVTPERFKRFFVQEDSTIRVNKEIREMLVFAPQNLVKDPPFTRLNLLSCRNMLIYLEAELQQKVLALFHYALLPEGLLFLGGSESLGSFDDAFSTLDKLSKIFANREFQRKHRMSSLRAEVPHFAASPVRPSEDVLQLATIRRGVGTVVDRLLLSGVAPSMLLTPRGEILYIHGRTGKFLEPAAGEPNANVFDMTREGLRLELPAAVREAVRTQQPLVRRGLQVRTNGGYEEVTLFVRPLSEPEPVAGMLLVSFEVRAGNETPDRQEKPVVGEGGDPDRAQQLEAELQHARENLQGTIEEFETSNEELKSMNEELQSTNEELQSANEELETSREEMQSLNEELQTLNAELQDRNEELSQINDDMQNLLNSTDVATLFLDRDLQIKRFTAPAKKVFHLRETDVGRPLEDMAASLLYEDLIEDAKRVLSSLVFTEQEVQTADGNWRLMRILPYRTAHNVIDGLVVTFLDIGQLKQAEQVATQAHRFSESILASLSEGLLVVTRSMQIVLFNPAFCRMFSVSDSALAGRSLATLGPGWDHSELRTRLSSLQHGQVMEPLRLRGTFQGAVVKDVLIHACDLEAVRQGCLLMVVEDLDNRTLPEPVEFD